MIKNLTLVVCFFVVLSSNLFAQEIKKPTITFLNPSIPESVFFSKITSVMQAAADNLGVKLEVVYANRNPTELLEKGQEIIMRPHKSDYLIMVNDLLIVPTLMASAYEHKQKTFLFNGPLGKDKYNTYISQNTNEHTWIGSLLPDEKQGGYLLAKLLVEEARKKNLQDSNGNINIIGVNGNHNSFTPIQREKGLRLYASEHDDVNIQRVVSAYWDTQKSHAAVKLLLKSHPDTSVIWSASDEMAIGAASGIKDNNKSVGKDIVSCGIDWVPLAFMKIKEGELSCSIGGHIFDGAWVMILLLDHFNKLTDNFIQYKTQFFPITKINIDAAEELFTEERWKHIDYKQFSRTYNGENKWNQQLFSSHALLKALF